MLGLLVIQEVVERAERAELEDKAQLVRTIGPAPTKQVHEVRVVERSLQNGQRGAAGES